MFAGQLYSTEVKLRVFAPSVSYGKEPPPSGMDVHTIDLGGGQTAVSVGPASGVDFPVTVTDPDYVSASNRGTWHFTQLIKETADEFNNKGGWYDASLPNSEWALDNGYFARALDGNHQSRESQTASPHAQLSFIDNPTSYFDPMSTKAINRVYFGFSAQDYVMYAPGNPGDTNADRIDVPLAYRAWNFGVSATGSGINWTLDQLHSSIYLSDGVWIPSTAEPEWGRIYINTLSNWQPLA
jgi:hypothetical protein